MSTTAAAPIALFVYNRPWHTQKTIEALQRNVLAERSELVIFSDGPASEEAAPAVAEVRRGLRHVTGFRSVQIVERPTNLGLSRSIVGGVGEVVARTGRVIVVEDDLVTSPHFLTYLNDGLEAYAAIEQVASIHAYVYPVPETLPETFFLQGADCWGWATWARAWAHFDPDARSLLAQLRSRGLVARFDHGGAHPFSAMLEQQGEGRNDSWAVRWHAATFLRGMLTLYPGRSLVQNIGLDGSGRHSGSGGGRKFGGAPSSTPITVGGAPLVADEAAYRAFTTYFRGQTGGSIRRWRARLATALQQRLGSSTEGWRALAGGLCPPLVRGWLRGRSQGSTWTGDYPSWADARRDTTGYDEPSILEHVSRALLAVKEGSATHERDSVLFDAIEYSWPLLAGLMWAAAQGRGRLEVVDFGGSLGSTYFQNRHFLDGLPEVRWNIVEQPHFVAHGRAHFQSDRLRFFERLDDCFQGTTPETMVLSSVLPYLEHPYELLSRVRDSPVRYLIIDRTLCHLEARDRLTVQRVSPSIYPASYPCWLLNEERLRAVLAQDFDLVADFAAPERLNLPAVLRGFIFARRIPPASRAPREECP